MRFVIVLSALAATASSYAGPLTGVFVGNSHTGMHDIPTMVARLLSSANITAKFEYRPCSWLDGVAEMRFETKPNIVVLQAQRISMSHTRNYSRDAAIALAKRARAAGAQVYLYSEFPMQGVDETGYIEDVYRDIATRGTGKIVPVGRAWDRAIKRGLKGPLWAGDGNHQDERGAVLTSIVFYFRIVGPDAKQPQLPSTPHLDATSASLMIEAARTAVRDEIKRAGA